MAIVMTVSFPHSPAYPNKSTSAATLVRDMLCMTYNASRESTAVAWVAIILASLARDRRGA